VQALVDAVGATGSEVLGRVPPKNGTATLQRVAVNAAMAGCLPEHLPVVLAALDAMLSPEFNLNGVQATTHPCAPLVIVSGPAVKQLGFNAKDGVFGGGSRANAGVGRAIRMILWNIGQARPGDIDKSTLGAPSKFAFCIAEDPDNNPWEPIHVSRDPGLKADDSAVTVFACEPNQNVADTHNDTPQTLLDTVADDMSALGNTNARFGGQVLYVASPERARVFQAHGWARQDVQSYLFEHARRKVRDFKLMRLPRQTPNWVDWSDPEMLAPIVNRPEDILVMVAGGDGPHSAICHGWGHHGGYAQTRKILVPS
jgi:hypothetical protein